MYPSLQGGRGIPGQGMGTELIGGPGRALGLKNILAARQPLPSRHITAVTRRAGERSWTELVRCSTIHGDDKRTQTASAAASHRQGPLSRPRPWAIVPDNDRRVHIRDNSSTRSGPTRLARLRIGRPRPALPSPKAAHDVRDDPTASPLAKLSSSLHSPPSPTASSLSVSRLYTVLI